MNKYKEINLLTIKNILDIIYNRDYSSYSSVLIEKDQDNRPCEWY